MAHSHGHGSSIEGEAAAFSAHDDLTSARTERTLWAIIILCAVITVAGLIVLWPRGAVHSIGTDASDLEASSLTGPRVEATVTSIKTAPCTNDPIAGCHEVTLEITSGEHNGSTTTLEVPYSPGQVSYHTGDDLYVYETTAADGTITYSFADFQRTTPLLLLGLVFVIAVVVLARWRGVGALGGLVASLLVLVVFMLPSLLRGHSPVSVALVGSALVAFIALYLAHGINISTNVALLATFASLVLVGLLAAVFVAACHFTGLTEDSTLYLNSLGIQIDARGLLLAGIVIGSLGVLNDMTVTQVSAVWELRQLQPNASRQDIYR
ncbi:MAG TPA: YibE/F family protein, partial [Ilumatobacteraceae bacterium]